MKWRTLDIERGAAVDERALRALLGSLCRRPALHARFLNTLSLMEHVGSRKILLSQGAGPLPEDVLRHLAEEARHAHFFRRAAEKIALRAMDFSAPDLLAPAAARMYMGRLDAGISRELVGDRTHAYRYVTLAVELRASRLYALYERALQEEGIALSLAGVLKEEDAHLAEMTDSLSVADRLYGVRRRLFETLEARLFERWLAALSAAAQGGQGELSL